MNIKKIEIKGLYGHVNKEIELDKSINLLVGINGSGKTSALNLISWLLQPSLPHLCTTQFSSLKLTFDNQDDEWTIRCTQSETELKYFLLNKKHPNLAPLVVQLKQPPCSFRTPEQQDEARSLYSFLGPDKKEQKTWLLVQNIPSPIVIGLERTLNSDGYESQVVTTKARSIGILPDDFRDKESINPLQQVQNITRDAYNKYRSQVLNINDDFRDKIMLSAFDDGILTSISPKVKKVKPQQLSSNQINQLQNRIGIFFQSDLQLRNNESNNKRRIDINKVAFDYLEKLKQQLEKFSIGKLKSSNFDIEYLLSAQFTKISKLVKEAELLEEKSKMAGEKINVYINTLNRFLNDSAKKIYFDPESGNILFILLNKNGESLEEKRSVEVLSSGEKQILILLTYLAFTSGKIFIIDEPELSLHPKWQEEFMAAVKSLMPINTQLIIATHSPIIVGTNEAYCKTLLPYNT
jgi:predicted ATP-dependent endonuclease of OLD family